MSIEMTVSEIAEVLGLSRQAINNRVKELPEEDTTKNDKGVTVVTRSGLIKLEEIYKKTIFEDEPVSDDVKQRELMEILVDEKNAEIIRLYEQLKAKDKQLAEKDEQMRVKDRQIAEKDKQLDQQQQLTLQAMKDQTRSTSNEERLLCPLIWRIRKNCLVSRYNQVVSFSNIVRNG